MTDLKVGDLVESKIWGLSCGEIIEVIKASSHIYAIKPIVLEGDPNRWTRSDTPNIFHFMSRICKKTIAPKLDDICKYLLEDWDKHGCN